MIITKIDTLNDKRYAEAQIKNKYRQLDFYISMSKSYNSEAELDQESARLKAENATLYAGALDSYTLAKIESDEAKDKLKEARVKFAKGGLYLDSAKKVNDELSKLEKKVKGNELDTKNFKGYYVMFRLMGSDVKNQEVNHDSLSMYVSPAFRIMPITSF